MREANDHRMPAAEAERGSHAGDDLRRHVAAELFSDSQVDSEAIEVSATGGTVTLRGTVASLWLKRAGGRAARVRGVSRVANELRVQIPHKDRRDDAGGGAVGAELAQAFARFGIAVTIVEAADRLLPAEEPEAGELIGEVLRSEGIRVLTRTRPRRVSHDGRDFTVHLDGAGPVHSQRLLVATGRRADLKALGVAAAGIDDIRPFIAVDDHLRGRRRGPSATSAARGRSRPSRCIKRAWQPATSSARHTSRPVTGRCPA